MRLPHDHASRGEDWYLKVQLRLYGVFRSAAGSSQVQLDVPFQKPTVRTIIEYLVSQTDFHKLKPLLIDENTMDPRPNALIMVSGREINTLNGLDTMVTEEDELSLLPVAHGGLLQHASASVSCKV